MKYICTIGTSAAFIWLLAGCNSSIGPEEDTTSLLSPSTPQILAVGDLVVEEAVLDDGELDVVGETEPLATITVDGCGGQPPANCACPADATCNATAVADDTGAFEVTADDFASPQCSLLVSDGTNAVLVTDVEDCESASQNPPSTPPPMPTPTPTPTPSPSVLVVDEASLDDNELDVIGESAPLATIIVDGCGGLPPTACTCPVDGVCTTTAQADDTGAFEVTEEDFFSPDCVLLVSDGTDSILVTEVEDCEPTSSSPSNPSPSPGSLNVLEAELDDGEIDVVGETPQLSAEVTVDGCAGLPANQCVCPADCTCVASETAEAGAFEVEEEDFASPNCEILVSDGVSSIIVTLDGCEVGAGC